MAKHTPFPPDPNAPLKPIGGAARRVPPRLTPKEFKSSVRARLDPEMDEYIRKGIYTRHKNALEKEKREANERVWEIDSMLMNRYELMEYLCILVSEGMDKIKLCRQEGWPTLAQVESWYKRFPDFKISMDNAERQRGAILGESSIDEVMHAEPHTAGLAKIRAEVLGKAAARMNSKYQDKQVIETADVTEQMDMKQIEDKILALQEKYPGLKRLGMKNVTNAEVVENQSQDGDNNG